MSMLSMRGAADLTRLDFRWVEQEEGLSILSWCGGWRICICVRMGVYTIYTYGRRGISNMCFVVSWCLTLKILFSNFEQKIKLNLFFAPNAVVFVFD